MVKTLSHMQFAEMVKTMPHILVVDDEPNIREVVELYMRREGYNVSVAADGEAALQIVAETPPDLIILDLMMPKMGGLEMTRILRNNNLNIPIIMLTAKGEEEDKLYGFESGADDYLAKPFSPRELVARVKAVFRRVGDSVQETTKSEALQIGELIIDPVAHSVSVAGNAITLTVKEFDLLWFLANSPSQVFTRDQLLDKVWGYNFFGDASTVTVHVRRLREKIEANPAKPVYILTVWGVGYKFGTGQ
ncbi:MAG: response regulator transcription factor [Chloroflexota bacterium]